MSEMNLADPSVAGYSRPGLQRRRRGYVMSLIILPPRPTKLIQWGRPVMDNGRRPLTYSLQSELNGARPPTIPSLLHYIISLCWGAKLLILSFLFLIQSHTNPPSQFNNHLSQLLMARLS
ncbi:hypothetical protein Pcinc_028382 [Petrolisthes cinctipes]|uniref:Uncharacterized protein n=1 Tax=Petrolisthes cinctipes TaxID=88211 RepID=A0AAE1K903_PETCI|nr:hypothetical protein Pcinc_028382 [Petrolisthes cinctipes]